MFLHAPPDLSTVRRATGALVAPRGWRRLAVGMAKADFLAGVHSWDFSRGCWLGRKGIQPEKGLGCEEESGMGTVGGDRASLSQVLGDKLQCGTYPHAILGLDEPR